MNPSSTSTAAGKPAGRPALGIDWHPQQLPAGATTHNVPLRTADGAPANGTLYAVGNPRSVVCLMHPREFLGCHYLVPGLLAAGVAVWAQGARSVGNDLRLEHEQAILDVAAGLAHLRERGFEKVVLVGNSGGSGLFTYYVQQAHASPQQRLSKSPTGRATGLESAVLPPVDGMVYLAPHPGQGRLLLGCIDPSVTDESDPLSVDASLDPFDERNGYAPAGEARYAPEFVQRYRAAQRERVRRIDERARQLLALRQQARQAIKAGDASRAVRLQAAHTPIVTVWRTDADLRCLDLGQDPSDRPAGSVWGADMFASNYGAMGFGRLCTPESWLSTWSGLSSNAALEKTAPSLHVPTLLVEYTGDQTTFPQSIREIFGWIATGDKQHVRVRGDHHGRPLTPGEEPGRMAAGREIAAWLRAKGFT
jgi:pimeloyl-ACP methyl ester carboxylesterase